MYQLWGFTHNANKYICLNKGLYRLKQLGNLQFNKVSKIYKKLKLIQSIYNLVLFYSTQKYLYIILYINNFKIIRPELQKVLAFKKKFGKVYKTKDLKKVSNYLGIKIERTGVGTIKVTQKRYATSILKRFKIINCKPTRTPIQKNLQLRKALEGYIYKNSNRKLY